MVLTNGEKLKSNLILPAFQIISDSNFLDSKNISSLTKIIEKIIKIYDINREALGPSSPPSDSATGTHPRTSLGFYFLSLDVICYSVLSWCVIIPANCLYIQFFLRKKIYIQFFI